MSHVISPQRTWFANRNFGFARRIIGLISPSSSPDSALFLQRLFEAPLTHTLPVDATNDNDQGLLIFPSGVRTSCGFFGVACLLIEPNCQPCKVTLSDFRRSQHVMSARSKRQRCQSIPHAALFIQASCKQTGKMPNRLLQPYDDRWISRCLLSFDCSSAKIPWAMAKFKFETPSRQPEARSDAACLGLRIGCSIRNL